MEEVWILTKINDTYEGCTCEAFDTEAAAIGSLKTEVVELFTTQVTNESGDWTPAEVEDAKNELARQNEWTLEELMYMTSGDDDYSTRYIGKLVFDK